jgi:murein DD-endopeptidase MepM/ murein hydrolase activator NlpD
MRMTQVLHRTLFFLLVVACTSSAWGEGMFITPIDGTPYQDWVLGNYVDVDPTSGHADYTEGPFTYNGHDALDIGLPNFAAMDAGVDVYAAAAGTVIEINDGEFDRYSFENPNPGNIGNFIKIDHGNNIETYYWHLKKNSVNVGVGDTVTQGQAIGQVGSSGNSSGAHLHFAVYENGSPVST